MHYAFDKWMDREFPGCPFERYADNAVVHCDTEAQARHLRAAIAARLGSVGLELHPVKTKIVYCKDTTRRDEAEHTSFDFLGYTFRGRVVRGPRGFFVGFNPAMSDKAMKAKGKQIRDWHLNRRSGADLSDLAEEINPQVRGWVNYYGAFYRSRLHRIAERINEHIVRWAMQKFKRLRGRPLRAWAWLAAVRQRQPRLFAHWRPHRTCLRSACGSPVRGDPHAGFCESRGVRLPPATHLRSGASVSDKYTFIDAGYATVAADTAAAPTVTRMCQWLRVSKSGFYEWRSRPESDTARRRELLKWNQLRCSRRTTAPTGTGGCTPPWPAAATGAARSWCVP